MRPIGRPTCVRNLFVCLITLLSPAETVEPIEMPFGLLTLGHVNHVGPIPPWEGALLEVI